MRPVQISEAGASDRPIFPNLVSALGKNTARLTRLQVRRKLWLQVHLWLGLILGLFLSVFGITGSILVFHQEVNEWLNPGLLTVRPPEAGAPYQPFERLQEAAEAVMPKDAKLTFADYPRNEAVALMLAFAVPAADDITESWQVAVDPYTGAITGKRLMQRSDCWLPETFIGFVFELHYALLLPEVGGTVVGILACALLFSVLTGLILWWPLTGKWWQALTIKQHASPQRFNYDLHKTSGFYTALVLFTVLLSGISLNLPEQFVSVVELFSPATDRYSFHSTPRPDAIPVRPGWCSAASKSAGNRGDNRMAHAELTQSVIGARKATWGNRRAKRLARLKARRKLWLKVHLWLGLALGFFLSIFGVTGSILVFHAEINELLNTELLTVRPPNHSAVYKPLEEIFEAGHKVMPEQAKLKYATYPRNDKAGFDLVYLVPAGSGITESWQVDINPYTAQVIGKRLMNTSDSLFPKTLIDFVFELHYSLFLGENIGYKVVGLLGALLIISVLTGLILWWPLTDKWIQALTIKRKASAERLNFDLHKTCGFYSAVILVAVLFSGIYMNLPQHVVPLVELFSPATYRYWFRSTPVPGMEPITMAEAVAIAKQRYPRGRPHWIYGAPGPTDTYTVCLDDVNRPGSWLQRVCVVLDRYTGEALDIDDPADTTAGEVFTHWQWPLHSGQAFGMTGRIMVFLTGLACSMLFVTGVIRWLQKRRVSNKGQRP